MLIISSVGGNFTRYIHTKKNRDHGLCPQNAAIHLFIIQAAGQVRGTGEADPRTILSLIGNVLFLPFPRFCLWLEIK